MDNKIEVIGIDHGWSGMKTVHEVFTSGCKEISTEPAFTENLLEYGGKYYKIGSKRLEVKDTKVTDEEVKQAMAVRVPKDVILSYFYPETSVVRMMEIRRRYE